MDKVHIVVSAFMNNWSILHQGIEIGGKQIYFHSDPQMSISNGIPHYNFDYMISHGQLTVGGSYATDILPDDMITINKRYNKQEQALRINTYVGRHKKTISGFNTFLPGQFWYNYQDNGTSNLIFPFGKVVVKPKDGARGIGQFLIDTDKVSFVAFCQALDMYINDKYNKAELFEELNRLDPDIIYSVSGENSKDEGLNVLKSQGFAVQSFVENVKAEYRIITDYSGYPIYCQERSIRKGGNAFPQATGSESNGMLGDDVIPLDHVLTTDQHEAFVSLCREIVGPLSSIDLFVTTDGQWGVFEYCNQFGITGVPPKTAMKLHRDFIEHVVLATLFP